MRFSSIQFLVVTTILFIVLLLEVVCIYGGDSIKSVGSVCQQNESDECIENKNTRSPGVPYSPSELRSWNTKHGYMEPFLQTGVDSVESGLQVSSYADERPISKHLYSDTADTHPPGVNQDENPWNEKMYPSLDNNGTRHDRPSLDHLTVNDFLLVISIIIYFAILSTILTFAFLVFMKALDPTLDYTDHVNHAFDFPEKGATFQIFWYFR